jgi:hypothetical protein
MPYQTIPHTTNYDPQVALPQHLDHKPVYALPYEIFDGIYSQDTDLRYISIGIAQYDQDKVSIKTMRHTGGRWTRQAEELPLHRPIDMTLFLAMAIFDSQNGVVNIQNGTFSEYAPNPSGHYVSTRIQNSEILITQEQRSYGEMASYDNFINNTGGLLKDRLNKLRDVLNDLKSRGKI